MNGNSRAHHAKPNGAAGPPLPAEAPNILGDIVIAYETVIGEADAENKPITHHLAHLAVHGFLHLLGHDHETDPDADAMEDLETRILSRIGIPDPYAARDQVIRAHVARDAGA